MEERGGKQFTLAGMGGSLEVANVQALAASCGANINIPERYIRAELGADAVVVDGGIDNHIPVLDLAVLVDPNCPEEEMARFRFACQEWGFFQLINHGVPEEKIQKMKHNLEEFFKLPLEEKMVSRQPPGSIEGYGQAFVVSEEQKLDWGDMLFLGTWPNNIRNTHLWPNQPPTFRATLEEYSLELKRVSECLYRLMAMDLGLNMEKFISMFSNGTQSMRMNYYPPCPEADKVLGIAPHSDAVALTLLLQVSETQGLQIKRKGGWIPIIPLPNAFIVNIGDVLEILTNGGYKSIEHRAVVNPYMERISIAAFNSANFDVPIGPILELLEEGREYYKTVSAESFLRMLIGRKLDGKGLLDQMKL